ncbi:MAG: polysaccharide deacetylase family protein [SAR324 cluster bacterium]|nr:polysaccharide deacetylase family protein [SAR324 cluster bacterium]
MTATFIVSFDCEGKWGFSDFEDSSYLQAFTNEKLNQAYEQILTILDRNEIKATFAFVGAFTLSPEDYDNHKDWFQDVSIEGRSWLSKFRHDASQCQFDGWFNPKAFEMVSSENLHEIASHGFLHLPLRESLNNKKLFQREITLIRSLPNFNKSKTFIYPRNMVTFSEILKNFGFIGYRDQLFKPTRLPINHVRNFLNELNMWQSPQQPSAPYDTIVRIPSGFFLNFRNGFRKIISPAFTLKRWTHLLANAIAHDGVVHLWAHPHNFIDNTQMLSLLEQIVKKVSFGVKRGNLINLTQEEYVRCILAKNGD